MTQEIRDKVIWVTGSATRLGRCIALAAARQGAHVVVHCNHSVDEGNAVAEQIRSLGRRAILVQGDHSRRADVESMAREIEAEFGVLYALVNSAAIFPSRKFEETTDEDFDTVINANLRGPFLCTQAALPLLRRSKPVAHVVNLVDARVWRPYRDHAAYWCSKGALDTLTRALANELAPDGIRVNAVHPGAMLPPPDQPQEERDRAVARNFIKRWGKPEDIANAVLYLLGSDYVTGTSLTVDGGRNLG